MGSDPELGPQIREFKSLAEQGSIITRDPMVKWPHGIDEVRGGRRAVFRRLQQPSHEQVRLGTALRLPGRSCS